MQLELLLRAAGFRRASTLHHDIVQLLSILHSPHPSPLMVRKTRRHILGFKERAEVERSWEREGMTYEDDWEEMDLAFWFSLSLFEVDKDREVRPPKLPVYKRWKSVSNNQSPRSEEAGTRFRPLNNAILDFIEYKLFGCGLLPLILPPNKHILSGFF